MATEAVGRRSHGLPSGLGGVLAALLADPEVAKAQQRHYWSNSAVGQKAPVSFVTVSTPSASARSGLPMPSPTTGSCKAGRRSRALPVRAVRRGNLSPHRLRCSIRARNSPWR